MFKFLKKSVSEKYVILAFIIVTILLSWLISDNASMVFAMSCFQCLVLLWLIPEMKSYYKTRKGARVKGSVLEVQKVKDKYDADYFSYSATIEFTWPDDKNKYQATYSDKEEIRTDRVFTVWVNETDPSKSIVTEKFHVLWWFDMIFWSLLVIGLFYLNYLRIKNML
jgi:Protein of unknown function (DUF3592)